MVNGRARSIGLPKWSFRIAVYTRFRLPLHNPTGRVALSNKNQRPFRVGLIYANSILINIMAIRFLPYM